MSKKLYFSPLRPIITIRDKWGDPTYLIHDAHNPPSPGSGSPTVEYCEVSLALREPGTIRLIVNDPEHVLDTSRVGLGNQVWVQMRRTPTGVLKNIFSGFIKSMEPVRSHYNSLKYVLDGFGSQIVLNERIVNFIRTARRDPTNTAKPFYNDINQQAWRLFKELFERTDIIPLVGESALKHTHRPGLFNTTDGRISTNVSTFIPSITEPYVEARQVADSIADMAGAIWGIRAGAPDVADSVYLRFPTLTHSGIIIKDRAESEEEFDPIPGPASRSLSYLLADTGWSFSDSIKKEDGFSNRIYSKTGSETVQSSSGGQDQFTPMTVDIAQQFTVTSANFRDLAFTISATGYGTPAVDGATPFGQVPGDSVISMRIVNDEGGRPGSLTEFQGQLNVDLAAASSQPVDVFFTRDNVFNVVQPGDKAWVILFFNSHIIWGTNHPQCGTFSAEHTTNWHHNGASSGGVSAIRTVCQPNGQSRTPPFSDTASGWTVNPDGRTYSYKFFDSFTHIVEASDQDSIDRYGLTESFIDASWITDEHSMNAFLASILQYTAKPKRQYKIARCTIPNGAIFMPGQLVTVIDSVAGLHEFKTTIAEVQEVRYEFGADQSGSSPLGATSADVTLVGYVDYKEDYIFRGVDRPPAGDPIPLPPPPPGIPLPPGPCPPCPPSTFPPLPPTSAPSPPPPAGQEGPYPSTGRQLGATTRRAVRHYASGAPDDETIEKNTLNIPYMHYQSVYYVTIHEMEHDDNISLKLGGTHMGSGWMDHGVRIFSGRTCLGTEPDHPNTNACIKTGASIGDVREKRVGIAAVWRKASKHTELWTRLPGGNWVKQLENTGALGGFTPNNSGNDEAQLRIDGFTDGSDPTIDVAVVQEIASA